MATDPNTMNTADYAMLYGSDVDRAVAYSLYQTDSIFKDVKFTTQKTLQKQGFRVTSGEQLPDVNWADVNEDPLVVKGSQAAYSETAWLIENLFKKPQLLDELEESRGQKDWFTQQYALYQQSFVYKTNEAFFNGGLPYHVDVNGAPAATPLLRTDVGNVPLYNDKEMKGIKARLLDGSLAPDMNIDCGGVDISATGSKASSLAYFSLLRGALDNMGLDMADDVSWYMAPETKTFQWTAAANAGAGAGFGTDKDAFERTVNTFMGGKIRSVSRKRNQYGRIIPLDENALGLSPTGGDGTLTVVNGKPVRTFVKDRTSIYAVVHRAGKFSGWQGGPLTMKNVGFTDNSIWEQALLRWYGGFWVPDTRCVCRLYNIKIGPGA